MQDPAHTKTKRLLIKCHHYSNYVHCALYHYGVFSIHLLTNRQEHRKWSECA